MPTRKDNKNKVKIVKSREIILHPIQEKSMTNLGRRIKLARKRRKYSLDEVAKRAQISKPTLMQIEKGSPKVSMGGYLSVLVTLGLGGDIDLLAAKDSVGISLEEARLLGRNKNA